MPHSLQCPHCKRAVQVADQDNGKRIACSHCQQVFLVPGFASSTSDDDDWLKLDDVLPPASPPSRPAPNATSSGSSKPSPTLSSRDAELLSQYSGGFGGDDLPPFESVSTPQPTRVKPTPITADEFPDGQADKTRPSVSPSRGEGNAGGVNAGPTKRPGGASGAGGQPKTPGATPPQFATEYRVNCPICGSMIHVKATQAGRTMKCHDCHSPVVVPQPPRVKVTPKIDLETAETFKFGDDEPTQRPADPFVKSAEELLRNAEKVEEFEPKPDFDTPSVKEWAKNVFGIFLDPGVLAHWLILSVFASVPTYIALSLESSILLMGLFPASLFFGVIVLGCGFAILQSLANEEPRVSEWPVFDPAEWVGQLMTAVAAVGIAGLPAYGLGHLGFGPTITAVAIAMFSIYLLFPFIILSMLDMQSIFTPFSPEVARSITRCEESWGGFYFSAGLVFGCLFLVFAYASTLSPAVQGVVCIFSGVAGTFIYFAMIGRLAFAVGQAVNEKVTLSEFDRNKKETP